MLKLKASKHRKITNARKVVSGKIKYLQLHNYNYQVARNAC